MTTHAKETNVTVTLSIRDWLVIGMAFAGLVAWGVRLEMSVAAAKDKADLAYEQAEKAGRAVRWYGPQQHGGQNGGR